LEAKSWGGMQKSGLTNLTQDCRQPHAYFFMMMMMAVSLLARIVGRSEFPLLLDFPSRSLLAHTNATL
jgi:hypothetical protein